MTTDEYDQLLKEIRTARREAQEYKAVADWWDRKLGTLLEQLDREEYRIALEALTAMHSASRKLVVGE